MRISKLIAYLQQWDAPKRKVFLTEQMIERDELDNLAIAAPNGSIIVIIDLLSGIVYERGWVERESIE